MVHSFTNEDTKEAQGSNGERWAFCVNSLLV